MNEITMPVTLYMYPDNADLATCLAIVCLTLLTSMMKEV